MRTMSPRITRAFAAVAAFASSFAISTANANPYELSIGGSTRALRSTSADAVTADSLDGGVATVARALPISPLPDLEISAEAGVRWGSAHGTMFQTMETTLDQIDLTLGARARYALLSHFAATAHAAFGPARTALELDEATATAQLSAKGSSWSAMVEAGAGIEAMANPRTFLECGARFEVSYIEARPAAITFDSGSGDASLQINRMTSSLGHLDASGPLASLVLWARF